MDATVETAPPPAAQQLRERRRRWLIILTIAIVVIALLAGAWWFLFASHYISSAQRLPNGNTLIDEGADGRLFEVTAQKEIVWEYVNPYFGTEEGATTNRVFRAQRVPYDWVPQLPKPAERAVNPPDITTFRVEPQRQLR